MKREKELFEIEYLKKYPAVGRRLLRERGISPLIY